MKNPNKHHMLFNEDELFHIFTSLFDIVYLMKFLPPKDFQYIRVSENAKKLASLKDNDIGKTISQIYHSHIAGHLNEHYYEAVEKNGPITFRDRLNMDNEEKYGESVLIPFQYNEETYVVGLTRDITHVVNLEKKQAYDPITGLPFSDNFISALNSTLKLKKYEGSMWNLYYISINQLSFIQYTNRNVETELLKQIANRLKRFLKSEDLLSRVSSNEFVIGVQIHYPEEGKDIAHQIYEAINHPFQTEEFETIVTPSIGVATINPATLDIPSSMAEAFQAMLRAKSKVDTQIVLPNDTDWSDNSRKNTLERDLSYALQKGQFLLYYQPKLDIRENNLNVEALLRWNHQNFGLVPPNEFIPLAEQNQLIKIIGKWVIQQVCKDMKAFKKLNPNIKVAINISPVQLNDANFVEDIKKIIAKEKVDPGKIELEITESDLLHIPSAQKQFELLSNVGFRLVLDDFGTSYSSLNYLKELSVQKIKIDKSFIMNMDYHQKDQQIVQMIIKLAKNLDLEVTAEGVEKWKHIELLTKMDCNEIQGYYLSKPLPVLEIMKKLEENKISLTEYEKRMS
ncbi:diguanylate cyclase (GGDEF)-like protein [Salirhabdus euzebyi]|uniref:Diguanylate cyclase (GGDEF)-like protein n=1 Tax=Salirhabdus euzebyi TaxID=394506 RepID=A0A841Q686_9BACI|nr:bifunctional diguanylate cyclase/phosphodiesterase [Salirhabdus euzebyi]MBB6453863.1 diguanylate cyclase (GGDEF)-like protein [Salirhabdus euzebyi]